MKILVYSDNHWCQYSSIVRSHGDNFSTRLENQIQSINWAEKLADDLNCEIVVHCGDFFDRENLNAMEISALDYLTFSSVPHYMVVGNHELGNTARRYNSMNLFGLSEVMTIINEPVTLELNDFHQIAFLPYILEVDRKPIEDYFGNTSKKRIIFSHNDIAGIQMGKFISQNGFTIENIEANCDLFINGHLHNGEKISKKIFNIGNLTGQNFSEDAFAYEHGVFVVDTADLHIDFYRNPYAFNFYKIDFTVDSSIENINNVANSLFNNAVVTIKCKHDDYEYLKKRFGKDKDDIVPHCDSILESRFIIETESTNAGECSYEELSVDHIEEFRRYIKEKLGVNDIILSELEEVLK